MPLDIMDENGELMPCYLAGLITATFDDMKIRRALKAYRVRVSRDCQTLELRFDESKHVYEIAIRHRVAGEEG